MHTLGVLLPHLRGPIGAIMAVMNTTLQSDLLLTQGERHLETGFKFRFSVWQCMCYL